MPKILLFLIIFSNTSAFSQHTISGKIVDAETNQSVKEALIYLTDLNTNTVSDASGNFHLTDLKTGHYLIEISKPGYKTFFENIYFTKDTFLHYFFQKATKELTEVIVTGVSRSTDLKKNPIIIKSIDMQSLQENSANNLIDALKNTPAINQITTGAAISKPVIRGLGYNRVISLFNGIRQEGQQWGDEHGIEIDEYSVGKIEIVKGPGSLLYGSDGIAGVLNFLSPKAPAAGKITTQLISNYQTNNNLIATSISNAGNKKGVQWLVRWTSKLAGNYQNKLDGKVLNSGFQEMDGSVFLGINKKWGHAHFQFNSFNTLIGLPEGERDSLGRFTFLQINGFQKTATNQDLNSFSIYFPHQIVNHLRFLANNYFILKKGTLHVDVGFQNNQRKEYGDAQNPQNKALYFDLNTLNLNARFNLLPQKKWETSVGIGSMFQENRNKGLEFLIPAYNLIDLGAFVFTQKTFQNKISLAGGIRFDNRFLVGKELILDSFGKPTNIQIGSTSQKFAAISKNYFNLSGSLGFTYQISSISTLKMNFSRGFRAPNIAELTSNGRHEGSFRYEYGNTNLKPEISHQIDIAYFLNSDHVSFEITPFANFISNYIYTKKLETVLGKDSFPSPSSPALAYQFSQTNAMLLGGEIFVDIHPHPFDWLHLENAISYVRATQNNATDSTHFLPFIPAAKYRGEIKAIIPKTGKIFTNFYLKFGVDYYFKQSSIYSANKTETPTPAYSLLNTGLGFTIQTPQKPDLLQFIFNVTNLTDVAYQNNLSRLKYAPINLATGKTGIYNMGRNLSVKLIINL